MARNSKKGFTLIELIIVIVIIGILASISAPMMRNMKRKAIASEAVTFLGAIRNAMRQYRVENGHYTSSYSDLPIRMRSTGSPVSDLDGTYFSEECYTDSPSLWVMTENTYVIRMYPANSNPAHAPRAAEANGLGWIIIMDQDGNIYSSIEGLGYPWKEGLFPEG